ncbi:hypothetical protein CFC21_045924 [Triticum aestivum]|uniref:Uncharacterized protein n=2 Tax=Triticum aestivum TaxID=4565 RepID=A0A9R1JZ48_WHEAT|nr:hypothetical protein CFC21_045924 [Triticum aestivum]
MAKVLRSNLEEALLMLQVAGVGAALEHSLGHWSSAAPTMKRRRSCNEACRSCSEAPGEGRGNFAGAAMELGRSCNGASPERRC